MSDNVEVDVVPAPVSLVEVDVSTVRNGDDGRELELSAVSDYICWRYVGESAWINLVALSELTGADGREIELANSGTFVQWRYVGDSAWTNLIPLADISGTDGVDGVDALPMSSTSSNSFNLDTLQPDDLESADLGSDVGFTTGARVRFTAGFGEYFEAIVTSTSEAYIQFQVVLVQGSGTYYDWTVNVAGEPGTQGQTGAPGSDATVTLDAVEAQMATVASTNSIADDDVVWFAPTAKTPGKWVNWLTGIVEKLKASFIHLTGGQTIQSSGSGVVALTLKAAAGATANIVEIRNSDGSGLAWISAEGSLTTTANLAMPATTGSSGIFFIGGNRGFHAYGSFNVFAGVNAGNTTMTGNSNSGVGFESLLSVTSGSSNMGFGYQTLRALTSGNYNVGIGRQSLLSLTTGERNAGVGFNSMYSMVGGSHNVAIGGQSMFSAINGVANTAVGSQALQFHVPASNSQGYNTAIGYATAASLTTGQRNVFIGALAGYAGTQLVTVNDSIAIGYDVKTTANNQINIGNTIYGDRLTGLVSLSSLSVSGNITGNGTNNTLPNQLPMASPSSIVTREGLAENDLLPLSAGDTFTRSLLGGRTQNFFRAAIAIGNKGVMMPFIYQPAAPSRGWLKMTIIGTAGSWQFASYDMPFYACGNMSTMGSAWNVDIRRSPDNGASWVSTSVTSGTPTVTANEVITGSRGSQLVCKLTTAITTNIIFTSVGVRLPSIGETFTVTGGTFTIVNGGVSSVSDAQAAYTGLLIPGVGLFWPATMPDGHFYISGFYIT